MRLIQKHKFQTQAAIKVALCVLQVQPSMTARGLPPSRGQASPDYHYMLNHLLQYLLTVFG